MLTIRNALLKLATSDPRVRGVVLPMTRQADQWEALPDGWDASSRQKFWDTLTGDNKHKVTKCIKEMSKGDKGIDDPGAFCAALADRVLGKEWRSKKASTPQPPRILKRRTEPGHYQVWMARAGDPSPYISDYPTIQVAMRRSKETANLVGVVGVVIYDDLGNQFKTVKKALRLREALSENAKLVFNAVKDKRAAHDQAANPVDSGATRFRDYMESKVNEHYRMAFPSEVPPTLSLIHGNDFIRVVKANGGLHREAVAFIARSTGNVYLAASWDRPKPQVMANVLQSDSWRTVRMAFDQYNVPELLGQLKRLLIDKGLDTTWDEIQKCKVPQKVNDAWMGLSKKERQRKAARLETLRSFPKYAADIRGLLTQLFSRHQPFVKDWRRFLHMMVDELQEWPDTWIEGLKVWDLHVVGTDYKTWTGKQTGGGWHEPPEYEESEVEVASEVGLKIGAELNLRLFPKQFTLKHRANVKDAKGFLQATHDMLANGESVMMLGKLLRSHLMWWIKGDPQAAAEGFSEITDKAQEVNGQWAVSYYVSDMKVSKVQFKPAPTGLKVWADAVALLDADDINPPESDYRGRWAFRLAELRAQRGVR